MLTDLEMLDTLYYTHLTNQFKIETRKLLVFGLQYNIYFMMFMIELTDG